MIYVRKPAPIDAIQWLGTNSAAIEAFLHRHKLTAAYDITNKEYHFVCDYGVAKLEVGQYLEYKAEDWRIWERDAFEREYVLHPCASDVLGHCDWPQCPVQEKAPIMRKFDCPHNEANRK